MTADELESILRGCELNDPATIEAIDDLERTANLRLPPSYSALMSRSNGLEGFVGEQQHLILWPIEQIAELNERIAGRLSAETRG